MTARIRILGRQSATALRIGKQSKKKRDFKAFLGFPSLKMEMDKHD